MDRVKIADLDEIIAAVRCYTEGCRTGDVALLRQGFAEGAVIYGYQDGQLLGGSIEQLFAAVEQVGGDEQSSTRIDVLSFEPTTAVVRVTMENWHNCSYTDFHSLAKIDGKWQIVAKVFQQH